MVLDDDPTGTQTVADVPVLTRWEVDDLRWAFQQGSRVFYVLTNTRSLGPAEMGQRNRQVVLALAQAAAREGQQFVVVSRGDSTLRGHFPAETDVLGEALAAAGRGAPDGVVIVPAYIEAGRLTVRSVHWASSPSGFVPVGESEFARDATFGYRSSDLREYVLEKAGNRWSRDDVALITVDNIRSGGPDAVAKVLSGLHGARPVVVDAACDDDLRVVALGAMEAESLGACLLYRAGPSFVRARAGLEPRPPLTPEALVPSPPSGPRRSHGLVVVGSHVERTTRQLDRLLGSCDLAHFTLDVRQLLAPSSRDRAVREASQLVSGALLTGDVVLSTTRAVVQGRDKHDSLQIARSVSSALVATVRAVSDVVPPQWVVAKGGITSSDIATEALEVRRAWVKGSLLPGIVSLWEPVGGPATGSYYAVFAGNVGDDNGLVDVVRSLQQVARLQHRSA